MALAKQHILQLTPRRERAHALLCDPTHEPEMELVVENRRAIELSEWLEARIGSIRGPPQSRRIPADRET